jgi:hypothetical protein
MPTVALDPTPESEPVFIPDPAPFVQPQPQVQMQPEPKQGVPTVLICILIILIGAVASVGMYTASELLNRPVVEESAE